jgi:hypothetical protein
MRVVIDAERSSILEDDARRTLNLYREQVGWILEPADFKFLAIERAGLNGASVVVRDQLPFLIAASNPRTLIWE